jgi:GrpB-like predicted nucleotidyltransferase (UPF0157 family)
MTEPLGLESGVVRVVEYDARWPDLFAAEAQRIRGATGALALCLEHIGGTAVPGIWAKPVLDILAGRPAGAPVADYVAALQRAGYVHRGEQGIAGREFFRRGQPRAYHVHLVVQDDALWRRYLAFRDYLRGDQDDAQRCSALKRSLAAQFPRDREAYIDGKAAFVQNILRRASGAASPDVCR